MMRIYVSQEFYNELMSAPEIEKRWREYKIGGMPMIVDESLKGGWYIVDTDGKVIERSWKS
jgi:hypothetical protein